MLIEETKAIASEIAGKITAVRRELHQYPELGFKEFKTSSLLANYLKDLGLEVKTNIAGTGLTGYLHVNDSYKTIALRADMDALPIQEENTVAYISKNEGFMHACGHDAHMAIVLGTAELLSRLKSRLGVNVLFIFQPGEEGLGGAKYMVDEGVLSRSQVEAILAAHVAPGLPTGHISVGTGPVMASPSEFDITIHGKGGHAAQHHQSVDPIAIGVQLVQMFQTILTREKNPVKNAVISVTAFNAGNAFNIIPDKAVIRGTVRTFEPELDQYISQRMNEISCSVAKAMGASCSFKYKLGYPPVVNHPRVVEQLIKTASGVIPIENIDASPDPSMLGEDFSYYTREVPGAMFNLGCASPNAEISHNLHSCRFNIDEDCLRTGMEIMSQWVINYSR